MKKEVDLLISECTAVAVIYSMTEEKTTPLEVICPVAEEKTTPLGAKLFSVELYFYGFSRINIMGWKLEINGIHYLSPKYIEGKIVKLFPTGTALIPVVELKDGTLLKGSKIII